MNETKILGLSGKKQSGKNTSANYVVGLFLRAIKVVEDFHISKNGQLIVTDILGNKEYQGILDLDSKHPAFLDFAYEHVYPFVKTYSYADLLKKNVCIDVLGLSYEQCFGTDEQKNTETHLLWENMPGLVSDQNCDWYEDVEYSKKNKTHPQIHHFSAHPPGSMTAREVMQFVGTEIFRKMYGNVWVEGTLRQIEKDSPTMAIISDVRFINEIEGITTRPNGKVVRFTRDPYDGGDQHESEKALDNYDWSQPNCIVIDNQDMTIEQQNQALHTALANEMWVPHNVPQELLEATLNV